MLFYVIAGGNNPILSRDFLAAFKLGIVEMKYLNEMNKIDEVFRKFPNVFSDGVGTFNRGKVSLHIKRDNVVPKFCKSRPLPYAMKEKVDQEIDR